MSLTDIAHQVNELATSCEQFKLINDRKLKEIENKGRPESATIEQLNKIDNAIDNCKERLDLIETSTQRPEVSTDIKQKNKDCIDYLRKGISGNLSHKTLSKDSNIEGGYLVTSNIMKCILKNTLDLSPMRQICSSQSISTETLECIIEGDHGASAGWRVMKKNIMHIILKIIQIHHRSKKLR